MRIARYAPKPDLPKEGRVVFSEFLISFCSSEDEGSVGDWELKAWREFASWITEPPTNVGLWLLRSGPEWRSDKDFDTREDRGWLYWRAGLLPVRPGAYVEWTP